MLWNWLKYHLDFYIYNKYLLLVLCLSVKNENIISVLKVKTFNLIEFSFILYSIKSQQMP